MAEPVQTDTVNTELPAEAPADAPIVSRPAVPTRIIAKDGKQASATFIFDGFEVFIDNFLVYDANKKEFRDQADTVVVAIELAHDLKGKVVEVRSSAIKDVKVQLSYETSLSVSNEGEHCDLIDPPFNTPVLPHHTSNFFDGVKMSEMKFQLRDFSKEESARFPQVNMDDIKKYVEAHCEKYYLPLIQNVKTIRDYPYYIAISRYYLLISGTYKDTGQSFKKLIVFERPLGD